MNKLLFALIFLALPLSAQLKPVAGETAAITYDPSAKGILTDAKEITLVYAFDLWGTQYNVWQGGPALFKNVETPDPGQAQKAPMTRDGKVWKASIAIPEKASLLSYYFTDGTKNDYNDMKTYVSYVYDKKMKPVRNARFSNVDFMVMAGKSVDEQIKELALEVKDYPENFLARFAYWTKRFTKIKDYPTLISTRKEFEAYFTKLNKQYSGNYDLMNIEARTYDQYNSAVSSLYRNEYVAGNEKFKQLIAKIPVDKMSPSIRRTYDAMKRSEESAKFNEDVVGKPAPEFAFETIKGEKFKLSDFRGKYVLLDFWGTWCGPCVGEIPNLKKAYANFSGKGLAIISISSDGINGGKDKEYLKKYVDGKEMAWNHVLDDNTIHTLYKISHWPTVYLVDKEGKIIRNETGLRGADLEKTLNELPQ